MNATHLRMKANAFYQLTKPGIIRLLVLTTICTMIVATRGFPEPFLLIMTLIGTAMVCGSANAINMVWDQDIDAIMNRTAHRPLVTGDLNEREALVFAAAIGLGGVLILTYFATPMAALMGIAGHAFYSVIYTMFLKRNTPQNIVIGGAAGAFPPLIGWAAVTGDLSWTAWLIFALIFLWTPPHFWALTLARPGEYARAGVPMLPVTAGEAATRRHITAYAVALLLASLAIGWQAGLGYPYFAAAALLGGRFVQLALALQRTPTEPAAWAVFGFSNAYLFLLFGAIIADIGWGG